MLALIKIPDVTSSLFVLIGPQTQTLILNIDWTEISIAGLWSVARHCTTPRALQLLRTK